MTKFDQVVGMLTQQHAQLAAWLVQHIAGVDGSLTDAWRQRRQLCATLLRCGCGLHLELILTTCSTPRAPGQGHALGVQLLKDLARSWQRVVVFLDDALCSQEPSPTWTLVTVRDARVCKVHAVT